MTNLEIISLVVTLVCLISFSAVFTILFKHYYSSNIEKINSGDNDLDLLVEARNTEKAKTSKKNKTLKIIGKVVSYLAFHYIRVLAVM